MYQGNITSSGSNITAQMIHKKYIACTKAMDIVTPSNPLLSTNNSLLKVLFSSTTSVAFLLEDDVICISELIIQY